MTSNKDTWATVTFWPHSKQCVRYCWSQRHKDGQLTICFKDRTQEEDLNKEGHCSGKKSDAKEEDGPLVRSKAFRTM